MYIPFNFIKKETLAQEFSCEFCNILKSTFFHGTTLVAASDILKIRFDHTIVDRKSQVLIGENKKLAVNNYY